MCEEPKTVHEAAGRYWSKVGLDALNSITEFYLMQQSIMRNAFIEGARWEAERRRLEEQARTPVAAGGDGEGK